MTKTFCDDCGREVDPFEIVSAFELKINKNVSVSVSIAPQVDLCRACVGHAISAGMLRGIPAQPEPNPLRQARLSSLNNFDKGQPAR